MDAVLWSSISVAWSVDIPLIRSWNGGGVPTGNASQSEPVVVAVFKPKSFPPIAMRNRRFFRTRQQWLSGGVGQIVLEVVLLFFRVVELVDFDVFDFVRSVSVNVHQLLQIQSAISFRRKAIQI